MIAHPPVQPPAIIRHDTRDARAAVRAAWKAVLAAETDTECERAWAVYQAARKNLRRTR